MFRSIIRWRDLTDGHLYLKGDKFPFDGREVPEERINSLLSGCNSAGFALLERVKDTPEEVSAQTKETPVQAEKTPENGNEAPVKEEAPKKAGRPKKKAEQ